MVNKLLIFQKRWLPVPFVIYADFEAITKKVQGCKEIEEMEKEKDKRSYTEAYQTYEDCGYGYKVVCCYDDKYSKPIQTYQGENAVYKFMEKMFKEVEYCKAVIKKMFKKPLVMTEDDEMCALKTIVTSLENSGVQLIKSVTEN